MKISVQKTCIVLTREDNDPKFYGVQQAGGESNLFYWLAKQFKKGHPDLPPDFPKVWIKKRMWKDGHMKDDMQQYLRSKKPVHKDEQGEKWYLCLYNDRWAIEGAEKDWNDERLVLTMDLITICSPELRADQPDRIYEQSKKNWDDIGRELGIPAETEPSHG